MTVQRAPERAKNDGRTRRERLRRALLGARDPVRVERLDRARRFDRMHWRTETYDPFGLGIHRDWRFAARDAERSR